MKLNSSVAHWKASREKLTAVFDISVFHHLLSDLASKMQKYTQVLIGNNLTVLGKPETN